MYFTKVAWKNFLALRNKMKLILSIVTCCTLMRSICAGEINAGRVLIIRHGEKNNKAKSGDVHLSKRGEIRADALARFFYPKYKHDVPTEPWHDFDLPGLGSVVAQSADTKYASERKIETARPIAEAGGIPLTLYGPDDIDELCDYLHEESRFGRTTLVVWDHSSVSDIVTKLLRLDPGSVKWPMDRYDIIWDIDLVHGNLVQYCQHLLYGDLWCPLNPLQVYPVVNSLKPLLNGKQNGFPLAQ